jgi:hypothetical protein
LLVGKGEHESILRYSLANIAADEGEHAQNRLNLYKDLRGLVLKDHRSKIHSTSLRAVFWARYHTMFSIITREGDNNGRHHQHHRVPLDDTMKTFLRRHPPSDQFKRRVDELQRDNLARTEKDILSGEDPYRLTLGKHFNDNQEMLTKYLALETLILTRIESREEYYWREQFNAHNRNCIPYIRRAVSPDVRNLTKTPERIHIFFKTYATPLAVLVSSILPISWAWAQILPGNHRNTRTDKPTPSSSSSSASSPSPPPPPPSLLHIDSTH